MEGPCGTIPFCINTAFAPPAATLFTMSGKVYEAFDWAYGDPVIHRDNNDVAAVAIGDTL